MSFGSLRNLILSFLSLRLHEVFSVWYDQKPDKNSAQEEEKIHARLLWVILQMQDLGYETDYVSEEVIKK